MELVSAAADEKMELVCVAADDSPKKNPLNHPEMIALDSRGGNDALLAEESAEDKLEDIQKTICTFIKNDGTQCKAQIDGAKDCLGGSDTLCTQCRKNQTTLQCILQKVSNEDTQQLLQVSIKFIMQLYQMLIGSMLILLVPQLCDKFSCEDNPTKVGINFNGYITDDGTMKLGEGKCTSAAGCCVLPHACTLEENFIVDYPFYLWGLIFNFIAFLSFLIMYVLEVYRENLLISLMDVNPDENNDGEDVKKRMSILLPAEYLKLKRVCRWYRYFMYISAFMFLLNTISSFEIVVQGDYSLGAQTDTTFVTNILFIAFKIIAVYSTVSTAKNVYYSAYLLIPVQYNDVDPTVILRDIKENASKEHNHDVSKLTMRAEKKALKKANKPPTEWVQQDGAWKKI